MILTLGAAGVASAGLQQSVDALVAQIEFRYRGDASTRTAQLAVVSETLAAWNQVESIGGGDANRGAMDDWVDRALDAAMPGGSGRLPEAPRFEAPAKPAIPEEILPPTPATQPDRLDEAMDPFETTPSDLTQPNTPQEDARKLATAEPDKPISAGEPEPQQAAGSRPRPESSGRVVAEKPVVSPAGPKARRSRWSRTPAAAPLDWNDPFRPDPAASPNPLRGANRRRTSLRPALPSRKAVADGGVTVDLSEFEAQVRGYNGELRRLQAELINRPARDADALNQAAERLGMLAEQGRFLELYRGGLDASQNRRAPMSLSIDLARELIRRRADELLGETPADRAEELRALRDLTDRMAGRDGLSASRGR